MKKLVGIFAIVMFAFTLSAQKCTLPKAKKVKKAQNVKIKRGVNHGTITLAEAQRIKGNQRSVNRTVRKATADGVVTRKEKAVIARKNHKVNRSIRRAKFN